MSMDEIIKDTKTVKEVSKLSELNYIKGDIDTACSKISLIEHKIDLKNEFVKDEVNIMLDKLLEEIQKMKKKMEEF